MVFEFVYLRQVFGQVVYVNGVFIFIFEGIFYFSDRVLWLYSLDVQFELYFMFILEVWGVEVGDRFGEIRIFKVLIEVECYLIQFLDDFIC